MDIDEGHQRTVQEMVVTGKRCISLNLIPNVDDVIDVLVAISTYNITCPLYKSGVN